MPYKMVKYNGGILTKPSLTIKNIVEDDAGYYTCKLKNKFENSEDVVELKVLCKLTKYYFLSHMYPIKRTFSVTF